MSWQQLHFLCDRSNADYAEALLLDEGAVSIVLEDAGDEPIFEPLPGETPLWSRVALTAFFDTHTSDAHQDTDFEEMGSRIAAQIKAQRFWLSSLEDKDWTREWMRHYTPINVRDNVWIVPKWETPPDKTALNIFMDPGLAFGTGYHATTRLCLDWLFEQNLQGKTVLDYGCGSGILAIAALLFGAKNAIAVDIDPQATLATCQNAELNGVADRLRIFLPEEFEEYRQSARPSIDCLSANILAGPLIALSGYFAQILPKGADIVLAGLIQSQVDEVMAAYRPRFLMGEPSCFQTPEDGHWYRLFGKKR